MQSIIFFLSSLITFSGLIFGILLIKTTSEEQKPLGNYFNLSRSAMLILISGLILPFLYLYKKILFFISIPFILFLFSKNTIYTYSTLGIIFYLSSKNINLFMVNAVIIFIYGMVYSAITYNKKKQNALNIIFYNAPFLLISNILFTTSLL